jgi:hypothetical protein
MEKNCKWFFGNEGGADVGPNDPIHLTFKGNSYYSIVREAIQNSLDAINDNRYPVHVAFQYFDLYRSEYPSFFELEEHIHQSLEYFKTNGDAQRLFGEMLKYLNGSEKGKKKLKVSCLKISDSNTKGMNYYKGTDSPFYAFLRATGVSSKILSGSGGSFGFGKGAYFALSPIKTLVVSSKDINGNVFFEGATQLTTHENESGEKITAYGFYDNNNGEPVTVEEDIPGVFTRVGTGTDINIIGLWDEPGRNRLMIKSVLNNFWLAIHENKLVVTIDDVIINKENLEQVVDEYFQTEFESGSALEIESWNPKPYYKAVKYVGANDQYKFFSEKLDVLGEVKMYVYLNKGLPDRVSYFRKPKMVVFKRTNRGKVRGYAAVFVCDNENGNEILRMMENPAHNEWRKENYPQDLGHTSWKATRAEQELSKFVNEKLESLSSINTSKKVTFLGLEEFLSIPEDLLEKDDDSELSGDNKNNFFGLETKELSHDETALQTTNKDEPITIKPTIKQQSDIKEDENVTPDEDGELPITTGTTEVDPNPNPDPTPKPGPDENINAGSLTDNASGSKVLKKVKLKVAAQKEQDVFVHNLIINCDEPITNGELELLVSGDNDKDEGVAISFTDKGNVQGNKLKDIALSSGRNQIKICFADNLKHSVRIKAYEIQ